MKKIVGLQVWYKQSKNKKNSGGNINLIKTNKDINEFEYCPTETAIKTNEKKERIIYLFIKS